jgi:hypothetical protein
MPEQPDRTAQDLAIREARALLERLRAHPAFAEALEHYRNLGTRVDGAASILRSLELVRPDGVISSPEWFRRLEHTRRELLHMLDKVRGAAAQGRLVPGAGDPA